MVPDIASPHTVSTPDLATEDSREPDEKMVCRSMKPRVFLCLLAAVLFATHSDVHAQIVDRVVGIGFKIGHTVGEEGGFTVGFEATYVWRYREEFVGIVLGTDIAGAMTRVTLGIEGGAGMGLSIGPSLVLDNSTATFGITASPFLGYYFYPYYCFTYRFEASNLHELGAFLKFPIATRNERREGPWIQPFK